MSTMMSDDFILEVPDVDSFKMWQGLAGPYFTPYIDEHGILSWTNTGGLVNPAAISVVGPPGKGLEVKGVVATYADLPQNPQDGDTYLVGTQAPYDGYMWIDGEWIEIGDVSKGETGKGIFSITKTGTSGLVDEYTILYTEGSPTVYYVTNGKDGVDGQDGQDGVGIPSGGTTGQVLKKASGTDYDAEWATDNTTAPATAAPLMDGTAAVGTSTKYAREDHVHPTDTSRASAASVEAITLKIGSITLALADWTGNGPWEQEVTLTGETVTANTMVNLQASPSTIAQLQANDITEIVAENDDGTVTIYCRGKRAPKANITLQYTLAETSNAGNVAILGNTITVGLLDFMEFDYNDGDLVPNATNTKDVSIMNGMISNGWVMMSFSFAPKVAFSSGTTYEIAELSTALYNKIGRTWRDIGIIETNKNVAASVRVDTWNIDENDVPTKSIFFTPSTSYATSARIAFSIMFPVSYNI